MISTAPSPAAPRRSGWFADRPLAVKFTVLVGVVVLAVGGVLASMLVGNGSVRAANTELIDLNHAQELVLQLDTRASELKVDGFNALVRDDPSEQLSELADERKARVIVVGTHGESPLKGALIGSTPHKLIQLARTPVLVVPAPS